VQPQQPGGSCGDRHLVCTHQRGRAAAPWQQSREIMQSSALGAISTCRVRVSESQLTQSDDADSSFEPGGGCSCLATRQQSSRTGRRSPAGAWGGLHERTGFAYVPGFVCGTRLQRVSNVATGSKSAHER